MSDDAVARPGWISGLSIPALRDYGIYLALIALIAYFSFRVQEFRTWLFDETETFKLLYKQMPSACELLPTGARTVSNPAWLKAPL